MEALRHAVLKNELAPLLRSNEYLLPKKYSMLEESDEDEEDRDSDSRKQALNKQ